MNDQNPGDIRLDSEGNPYLTDKPAKHIAHAVYQKVNASDVGSVFTTLYATQERDMVNGINHLYGTNFTWGMLNGLTRDFFDPVSQPPFIRLQFSEVGEYYVAQMVVDPNLQIGVAKPSSQLHEMLDKTGRPEQDTVYYTTSEDAGELAHFLNNQYLTQGVTFSPYQDIQYCFAALANDDFLTPIIGRNYHNNGGYSTLLFKNEVIPAINLGMSSYNQTRAIATIATYLDILAGNVSFITPEQVEAFDPYKGILEKYTIFKMARGSEVNYMAASAPVTIAPPEPTTPPGEDGSAHPPTFSDSTGLIFTARASAAGGTLTVNIADNNEEWELYKNDVLVLNNSDVNTMGISIMRNGGYYRATIPLTEGVVDKYMVKSIATRVFINTPWTAPTGTNDIEVLQFDKAVGTYTFTIPVGTLKVPSVLPTHITDLSRMFHSAQTFNQDISMWDTSRVTSMESMFYNAKAFNQALSPWDTSKVTNMASMFYGATVFSSDLSGWNTGGVTNMSNMFYNAKAFNQPIGMWNVSNVKNMGSMFYSATGFSQELSGWDTSSVTAMDNMFSNHLTFNKDIGMWNVGNVTNMSNMFNQARAFNQDISGWNVSKVTNMAYMFYYAYAFNQPIGTWDTSSVNSMVNMFYTAKVFNQDISTWNVSNVTNMSYMFTYTNAFNQPIGTWDTGKVTNMSYMFNGAIAFNQDISPWVTINVTDMSYMFSSASVFNRDLSRWCVPKLPTPPSNFNFAASAFNKPKPVWGTCPRGEDGSTPIPAPPPPPKAADSTGFIFSLIANDPSGALDLMIADNDDEWELYKNDELVLNYTGVNTIAATMSRHHDFFYINFALVEDVKDVYKVKSAANKIYIATPSGVWNSTLGTHDAEVLAFDNTVKSYKLSIPRGTLKVPSSLPACVTSMYYMFASSTTFNQDISMWDTSNVTNMDATFLGTKAFNQPIGNWNVSNVTSMVSTFHDASAFSQNLSGWNVSNVTNMATMFTNTTATGISGMDNWNVSKVTNMNSMFQGSLSANNINFSTWDTSNVTNMTSMFRSATTFNQPIGMWNVSKVTNMSNMFDFARAFNQDISTWNVGNVTNMASMFSAADMFNQDISSWNTANVTTMASMFNNANVFDQNLNTWNTRKVTTMASMFNNAYAFNRDISSWNTSKVTTMASMFNNARAFNQDLSQWCVGLITTAPSNFAAGTTVWTLPKPVWGTCPRGENAPGA